MLDPVEVALTREFALIFEDGILVRNTPVYRHDGILPVIPGKNITFADGRIYGCAIHPQLRVLVDEVRRVPVLLGRPRVHAVGLGAARAANRDLIALIRPGRRRRTHAVFACVPRQSGRRHLRLVGVAEHPVEVALTLFDGILVRNKPEQLARIRRVPVLLGRPRVHAVGLGAARAANHDLIALIRPGRRRRTHAVLACLPRQSGRWHLRLARVGEHPVDGEHPVEVALTLFDGILVRNKPVQLARCRRLPAIHPQLRVLVDEVRRVPVLLGRPRVHAVGLGAARAADDDFRIQIAEEQLGLPRPAD
eukprot:scaffold35042_cov70-Phaeocystis_antarctica.AAC.6